MSRPIRSTSSASGSSKRLDLVRAHPEHRVRVLPDLRERDAPPRLALGVELLVPDLPFDLAHGGSVLGAFRTTLRIDVDDRGQAVAAHRRRGGGQQAAAGPATGRGLLRLREELRAMAAAEPQERRRAEQLGVRTPLEPTRSSVEAPAGPAAVGPETTTLHEMAETADSRAARRRSSSPARNSSTACRAASAIGRASGW